MFNELHFEIQNKCLLNCKHCSSKQVREGEACKYGINEIKELIHILEDPIHIYFTGGEPLINESISTYIEELKKYRNTLDIGIFTCGIVIGENGIESISREMARYYKDIGLSNCYISIYDLDEKNHSKITNIEKSLDYTLDTIKNFISVGITVKVHLVLNKYNINRIEEILVGLGKIKVAEVRILRLVNTGSATDNWDEIGVDYNYQNKIIKNIIKNIDRYNVKLTISGFPNETPCRPFEGAYRCQGGTNVLYIDINGNVYPCACTKSNEDFKIANISEVELIKIYKTTCGKYNELCLNSLT
ncbi:radical SAM/SPASM domain-containing protein [Clostridium neonatale]|uniref:radical SAM/SPASM domain-containing protein n=1 Tax=Clostridium neonatale TaxID=137838 RepID=UPI00291B426C|nr:radical SAM protein [Clostridium neonatale]CAI3202398.1 Radical SAM protein [Clostridium neonatale]CAI3211191.1 Radical SAM protein [Clostridium neonatale]